MLSFKNVSVTRNGRSVLQDVSLSVSSGRVHVFLGRNGEGKSTLLQAAIGALPFDGQVELNGRDVATLGASKCATELGYMSQSAPLAWPMSVADFITLGAQSTASHCQQVVTQLGLESLLNTPATALSGGQYVRVRIARVLMGSANVLLFDEPVAHLDPQHQLRLMSLFKGLAEQGKAIGVVLHDLTLASRLADDVSLLSQGRVVASGPPRQVLTPAHLSQVFGIEARRHEDDAGDYWVPWAQPEEKHYG